MTAENLRNQLKDENVMELLPLLDVYTQTKNILTRFSTGQTCSIIGKEHGVPGKRIKQTILLVLNIARLER